jgi:hypothetical protein
MDSFFAFAGNHPVVALLIAIPAIGWSGRIILEIIRRL